MRRTILLAGLLALAACSTAPASAPPPQAEGPAAPQPTPEPSPAADACNARGHQHLVGRPRSEVPTPVKPELQRVACVGCPITMDYNPERLNVFFDSATGVIKEVRCG